MALNSKKISWLTRLKYALFGARNNGFKNDGKRPDGPPDLEEIWRDLSAKFTKIGERKSSGGNGKKPDFDFTNFQGSNKIFAGILALVVLFWLGSGFYIVNEGQKGVVTQFGKFYRTTDAGWNYRLPYPIQAVEKVNATQLKSIEVGDDRIIEATGLKTSGLLTADGNIIEIKFEVQYRLKVDNNGVRDYVFETKNPDDAVRQVAESALREVVGKMTMDKAIGESRDQIAPMVRKLSQEILDQYKTGVEVVQVNMLQGGVRPPQQVQSAFDDVLKAEQEAERIINEAGAYKNNKVPLARGRASRLAAEAQAYYATVTSQASGDSQRFALIVNEYKKSPKVVKDRIYIDAMQEVYKNVNKIIVDSKQNSNLLYLPLDQLLKQTNLVEDADVTAPTTSGIQVLPPNQASNGVDDERSRSNERTRSRD